MTATAEKVRIERSQAEALLTFCGWGTAPKMTNQVMSAKLKNVKTARPEDKQVPPDLAQLVIDVEAAIENGQEFEVYKKEAAEPAAAGKMETGAAAGGVGVEESPAEEPAAAPSKQAEDGPKVSAEEKAKAAEEKAKAALEKAQAKAKEAAEKAQAAADKAAAKAKEASDKAAAKAKAAEERAAKAAAKAAEKEKKKAERAAGKTATNSYGIPGVHPQMTRSYCAGIVLKKYGQAAGVTQQMIDEVDAMYGKPNQVHSRMRLSDGWHLLNAVNGTYPVTEEPKQPKAAAAAPAAEGEAPKAE